MRIRETGVVLLLGLSATSIAAQQVPDSAFDTSVRRPAHTDRRPTVIIDEAHQNFHTSSGRYWPFARLLRNDGYNVVAGTTPFSSASLRGVDVLVISNAVARGARGDASASAFSDDECDAVRDWVRAGGALLLIADHAPYGSAAEELARRFGVDFGKGYVFDSSHFLPDGPPTNLVFSRENALLGVHPILTGRDSTERVNRVVTFTGQSMSVPAGAAALLRLAPGAREGATRDDVWQKRGRDVAGRAQGIAMRFGRGRVVVLGEAAMMSAQIARWTEDGKGYEFQMGMNLPGSDDKQLALNVMRWLSGVLD